MNKMSKMTPPHLTEEYTLQMYKNECKKEGRAISVAQFAKRIDGFSEVAVRKHIQRKYGNVYSFYQVALPYVQKQ